MSILQCNWLDSSSCLVFFFYCAVHIEGLRFIFISQYGPTAKFRLFFFSTLQLQQVKYSLNTSVKSTCTRQAILLLYYIYFFVLKVEIFLPFCPCVKFNLFKIYFISFRGTDCVDGTVRILCCQMCIINLHVTC